MFFHQNIFCRFYGNNDNNHKVLVFVCQVLLTNQWNINYDNDIIFWMLTNQWNIKYDIVYYFKTNHNKNLNKKKMVWIKKKYPTKQWLKQSDYIEKTKEWKKISKKKNTKI